MEIQVLLFEEFNTITCTLSFTLKELATYKTLTSLTQLLDLLKIQGKIFRFFASRKEQMILQLSSTFHLSFITMATTAVSYRVKKTIFNFLYTRQPSETAPFYQSALHKAPQSALHQQYFDYSGL